MRTAFSRLNLIKTPITGGLGVSTENETNPLLFKTLDTNDTMIINHELAYLDLWNVPKSPNFTGASPKPLGNQWRDGT